MTPSAKARQIKGAREGARVSIANRTAEKAEGMAFARAWRERMRGTDWSRIPAADCNCPLCRGASA